MRIPSTQLSENLAAHLQRIAQRQHTVQSQLATGQRVASVDQDPLAAQQTMALREQSKTVQQYEDNAAVHKEFASATFSVLRSLQTISNRAQEIATSADGLSSPEELKTYAAEIGQLIKQAVQTANTRYQDAYIFSGTKSATPAFSIQTDANGNVLSVTFGGNTDVPESEIGPGQLISSRLPGANGTGSGERGVLSDSRSGADFFSHLIALHQQLLAGDAQAIENQTRGQLRADEENFLFHLANNGALQSRLDAAIAARGGEALAVSGELSRRADVDVAEVSIRLQQTQLSYQAALQSSALMLDLSLLNFLR